MQQKWVQLMQQMQLIQWIPSSCLFTFFCSKSINNDATNRKISSFYMKKSRTRNRKSRETQCILIKKRKKNPVNQFPLFMRRRKIRSSTHLKSLFNYSMKAKHFKALFVSFKTNFANQIKLSISSAHTYNKHLCLLFMKVCYYSIHTYYTQNEICIFIIIIIIIRARVFNSI